jgi:hypothetical protein
MRMHGSARDLLSHMELLGLASIISSVRLHEGSHDGMPVTIGWESPDTMVIDAIGDQITIDGAAEDVRTYLDLLHDERDAISRDVSVGGKAHSPLSPRIAKDMTQTEWQSYQYARNDIIDQVEPENPLFASLIAALGFPAYWSGGLSGQKGKLDLDQGASKWEMAARNSGSEFMKNKYRELVRKCDSFSAEEIASHIRGDVIDDMGNDRNSCGLHAPASIDALMALIALNGISLFSTRPVTSGSVGSISTGVLITRANGRKSTFFVLPVANGLTTLAKYVSVCRYSGLYEVANHLVQGRGRLQEEVSLGKQLAWLKAHRVDHIAIFNRYVGGSPSCPEYYALEGALSSVATR